MWKNYEYSVQVAGFEETAISAYARYGIQGNVCFLSCVAQEADIL